MDPQAWVAQKLLPHAYSKHGEALSFHQTQKNRCLLRNTPSGPPAILSCPAVSKLRLEACWGREVELFAHLPGWCSVVVRAAGLPHHVLLCGYREDFKNTCLGSSPLLPARPTLAVPAHPLAPTAGVQVGAHNLQTSMLSSAQLISVNLRFQDSIYLFTTAEALSIKTSGEPVFISLLYHASRGFHFSHFPHRRFLATWGVTSPGDSYPAPHINL